MRGAGAGAGGVGLGWARSGAASSPPFACSIRENLQLLVDRPDGTYCFRLHNDRVYYVR